MTSRSERRRPCQSQTTMPSTDAHHLPSAYLVDAATGTSYCLGALDEPLQFYRVLATFVAGDLVSDRELGRAYCSLSALVPVSCDWRDDALVCELLCTAFSAEAAAWRVVERAREDVELRLMQVEAGLTDAAAPEVVLTSNAPDDGARAEEPLCG